MVAMDVELVAQVLALLSGIAIHFLVFLIMLPAVLAQSLWCQLTGKATGKDFRPNDNAKPGVAWYRGTVHHTRRLPQKNTFRYGIRIALVSLDNAPGWFKTQAADHLSADEARQFASTTGLVKLLTNPRVFGYVQNPISVYYCYDRQGALDKCIAEVTNTPWGERVTFVFCPSGERVQKALHVSPFMDMDNTWLLAAPAPGAALRLVVNVDHPQLGRYFDASLVGVLDAAVPQPRNEEGGLATLLRYGWQPHRLAILIYWQAVRLVVLGAKLQPPPSRSYRPKREGSAKHPACMARTGERGLAPACPAPPGLAPAGTGPGTGPADGPRYHVWRAGLYWPWTAAG